MPNFLTYKSAQRQINATAAGTTVLNGPNSFDMQGYDGVVFVAALGTLTASQVTFLGAQGSADGTTWGAVGTAALPTNLIVDALGAQAKTAAMADADSNKLLVLDVFRPQQRYIRAVLYRGTANAVVDGVIAIRYEAKKLPSVQDATTVSASKFVVGS
jgi:hypothetical protein